MARWKHNAFFENLKNALGDCDYQRCSVLSNELINHLQTSVDLYDVMNARDILSALRRKRYFDLMIQVSDAFLRTGITDSQIQRQYAQALLDQSKVYPALTILEKLLETKDIPSGEFAQAKGLIGRAYKQIYTDAKDVRPGHTKDALRKAINAYYQVYDTDENQYWHGVNTIALLARAHRDGVDIELDIDYKDIARKIVAQLSEDGARDARMWELGSLAEACVALHDWENAAKYLNLYLKQNSDAFEIASTLRQFEDVWQLDTDETAERAIVDLLRAALLKKSGGEIHATVHSIKRITTSSSKDQDNLEKILGDTGYQSYQWLLLAMEAARCVGRVWHGPKGVGTGFILPGRALSPIWDGQQVFVTNNHVISKPKGHNIALFPEQATITFDILNEGKTPKRYKVAELLWQSGVTEFDATVLRLDDQVEGTSDFTLTNSLPTQREKDRIYVIGHPKGGELSFSFQDNTLIDFDERLLHYRSPTDPGSSGSPIFNESWELIGLHHAGSNQLLTIDGTGYYAANEGISLPAIIECIENLAE